MKQIALTILSTVVMSSAVAIVAMPQVLAAGIGATGRFSTLHKGTTGNVKIIKSGNRIYLEFSASFETGTDCPDLKIILYRESEVPLHLKEKKHLNIGIVRKFKGLQRHEIPSDVNLKEIHSVGLWCDEFDKVFGYAPLK
jgi:Electron transfer DM13